MRYSAHKNMERFWSKVNKTDHCWLWTASKSGGKRYGRIYFNGKEQGAHRVSYQLSYGPIPVGLEVCHKCDVPLCVRPDHLFVGTHKENMDDAKAKNRWALRSGLGVPSHNSCRNGHQRSEDNTTVCTNGKGYRVKRCLDGPRSI